MVDILHRVGVKSASTDEVYAALTTLEGLSTAGGPSRIEFMYHCSTKWATFLLSLKQLIETGTGAPDPDDVQISDWH